MGKPPVKIRAEPNSVTRRPPKRLAGFSTVRRPMVRYVPFNENQRDTKKGHVLMLPRHDFYRFELEAKKKYVVKSNYIMIINAYWPIISYQHFTLVHPVSSSQVRKTIGFRSSHWIPARFNLPSKTHCLPHHPWGQPHWAWEDDGVPWGAQFFGGAQNQGLDSFHQWSQI